MIELHRVSPGDLLPTFRREGTFHHWNRFAAVNDEFADHHMDDEVGRSEGFAAAFIMAPLEHAYVVAMLRAWTEGRGRIVSVAIRLRSPLLRGRTLIAGGEVTQVQAKGREAFVDVSVWEDDDLGVRLASGLATVALLIE